MDDEIERLVIGVRADTGCFGRDVEVMRTTLEDGLGKGAERAGRSVEAALARAVRTGKLGFDDLKSVALHALGEIAMAGLKDGVASVLGNGSGGVARVLGGLLGLPGRATGGPVSPGRAYLVGERGPEVFVPTTSGQVVVPGGGARDVRVAITINASGAAAPEALARSGRQVARAVRAALMEAE